MRDFYSFSYEEMDEIYANDPAKGEFIDYLVKQDSEGGHLGYIEWGGVDRLPDELKSIGQELSDAHNKFLATVNMLEEKYGVKY